MDKLPKETPKAIRKGSPERGSSNTYKKEIQEAKTGSDSPKRSVYNPVKEGATFKPERTPETLENIAHSAEMRNKLLNNIKNIKNVSDNENSLFYRARMDAVEPNAFYYGKTYGENSKINDYDAEKLVEVNNKFLSCLDTLDIKDINDPNNLIKLTDAYKEADRIANDEDLSALEKRKISEWGLNLNEHKTMNQIWEKTTDKIETYDYSKITMQTIREAIKDFSHLKNKDTYDLNERICAEAIYRGIKSYGLLEYKIGRNRTATDFLDKDNTCPPNGKLDSIKHAMRFLRKGSNKYENGDFKSSTFEYYYKQFLIEINKYNNNTLQTH